MFIKNESNAPQKQLVFVSISPRAACGAVSTPGRTRGIVIVDLIRTHILRARRIGRIGILRVVRHTVTIHGRVARHDLPVCTNNTARGNHRSRRKHVSNCDGYRHLRKHALVLLGPVISDQRHVFIPIQDTHLYTLRFLHAILPSVNFV